MRVGTGRVVQEEEYQFSAPAEVVWAAVQRGAGQAGWPVASAQGDVLALKIPAQGVCNPATLTAEVFPLGPCTGVRLTASCFGLALVMNGPLLGYVRTLLGLIDAQIQSLPKSGPKRPAAALDDLERLARLHREGALTDEEFTRAKQKLLT